MTADSEAVARARRMANHLRLRAPAAEAVGDATPGLDAAALDAVLAELDEAHLRPRVWLEGDEVPAGVCVAGPEGFLIQDNAPDWGSWVTGVPVVEVIAPDYRAVVAAERERRTGDTR